MEVERCKSNEGIINSSFHEGKVFKLHDPVSPDENPFNTIADVVEMNTKINERLNEVYSNVSNTVCESDSDNDYDEYIVEPT